MTATCAHRAATGPRRAGAVLLLWLCAGCGHREAAPQRPLYPSADAPQGHPTAPPVDPRRAVLSLTVQVLPQGPGDPPRQRLALVLRLPSGAAQTQDLGEVDGACSAPPPPPGVLGLYHCETAGAGSEFVIRRHGPEIVVTLLGIESGAATAGSREVARMTAPSGDAVTFQVAP